MTSLQIQEIIHRGQRYDLSYLRLYVQPTAQKPQAACIVGKKVHRSAVVRHRYQRLLREATRALIGSGIQYDMVVVAKPEIISVKKLSELYDALKPPFNHLV